MKVAPVDRLGSWRPPNADTRIAAVSRVQSIAPSNAQAVDLQAMGSETELPPTPVQATQDTLSRPVLASDKSQAHQNEGVPVHARQGVVSTVAAFAQSHSAPARETDPAKAQPTSSVVDEDAKPGSLLEARLARQNPDKLTSLELATKSAKQFAAEQAKIEAARPPKTPLSQMLMEQVKSIWEASGKAVEATLNATPAPATPVEVAAQQFSATVQPADPTYSVPRPGAH